MVLTADVINDFAAGTIAGMTSIVLTQPLDTARIRLQAQNLNQRQFFGLAHCLKATWMKEGFLALYKGLTPPMLGVGAINAAVFGANTISLRWMNDDSLKSVFLSGCFAGSVQSLIASPVELVKIRLQLHGSGFSHPHKRPYTSSWDCVQRIVRAYGVMGLSRGLGLTILRDMPGYGAYFLGFEAARRYGANLLGAERGKEPIPLLLVAGSVAGISGWFFCYPFDVLKTRLQGQPFLYRTAVPNKGEFQRPMALLRQGLRTEGPAMLYTGLNATLARAIPTNAIIFCVYELTMRILSRNYHS